MSGGALRANPYIKISDSEQNAFPVYGIKTSLSRNPLGNILGRTAETVMRTVTVFNPSDNQLSEAQLKAQTYKLRRTNFLPDSATRIFFPGWDITFSGGEDTKEISNIKFYATYGLGSPFVEDSKLCAAVNGMWAAASPDAARTFRNSLSKSPDENLTGYLFPPTAIPLTDRELGYHGSSPAVFHRKVVEVKGWDGEHGPFIFRNDKGKVAVNFTDVNRSDYVQNALRNDFDMSQLRELDTQEVIQRMTFLKECFDSGLVSNLRKKYWLVGVEKCDWDQPVPGNCVPDNLWGETNKWAVTPRSGISGGGLLLLFARTKDKFTWVPNTERNNQLCSHIAVFQVSKGRLACCKLNDNNGWQPMWTS